MKCCILARFTFIMGFWGGAPSTVPGQSQGSGDEVESFEAIVHLQEVPKLVKTLMQSKYCAVTTHWSQSWGPKVHGAPTSSLGACAPGSATDRWGQTRIVGAAPKIFGRPPLFHSFFQPCRLSTRSAPCTPPNTSAYT